MKGDKKIFKKSHKEKKNLNELMVKKEGCVIVL